LGRASADPSVRHTPLNYRIAKVQQKNNPQKFFAKKIPECGKKHEMLLTLSIRAKRVSASVGRRRKSDDPMQSKRYNYD
jgi:hypothetical protein